MNDKYVLIGQSVVLVEDTLEWSKAFETCDRRVGLTKVGPYYISTVFLGLDHSFMGGGPPLLFETMVWIKADFDSDIMGKTWHHDRDWLDIQERCSTWLQAEAQHQRVVDQFIKEHPEDPVEQIRPEEIEQSNV